MGELDWRPNVGPQAAFLMCPVGEILYGGAKGGGKSDAIGPKAVKHVLKYGQHATVLILRETMPQLRDLMKRVRPHCLRAGATFNKVEKTWTFPSGASIIFGHLSAGCDPYWGQEYTMVVIDEITRCLATEVDYLELLGSLRSSHGVPCQVILTSNPGGKGHNWVKARFMGVPPLTVQRDPESGLERVFIPASLRNNPHLPKSYAALLAQMPDAEREAFLEGNWDAFEGRIFRLVAGVHIQSRAQFAARVTQGHKPEEMDAHGIPKTWRRFRAYDHGFAAPGACLWFAVAPDHTAYVYRELYTIAKDSQGRFVPNDGARMEPRKVAARIAELSAGETYGGSWTGPDLFYEVRQDQAGGVKVASHFQAEGLSFTAWRANAGSRLAGKQALHQRLAYEVDAAGKVTVWPKLVLLEGAAPHLERTLPALEYDPHDVELWDSDGEDHCLTGDTIVHTVDGGVPIADLVGTTGYVVSFDGECKVVRPYFDCRKTQADVAVYAVRFFDGRQVCGTANHPLLTVNGDWVRLDAIQPGDRIRSVDVIQLGAFAKEASNGDSGIGNGAGIPGGPVLPMRPLLPAEGQAPTPGGLGVLEWAGAEGASRPPQGPRPGEQSAGEPGMRAAGGALVAPLQLAGGEGDSAAQPSGEREASGCGVALVAGGAGVPSATGSDDRESASGADRDLHGMRVGVHDERSARQGAVLPEQVPGQGSTAGGWDSPVDAGAEGRGGTKGVGYATVEEVVYVGNQDVYNLEVADTHCFAVNGGLVVHNCPDALMGFCKMNPLPAAVPAAQDPDWMRARHVGGQSSRIG